MDSPTTIQGNIPAGPTPVPAAEVPKHLHGTRAAIFHLFHLQQAQKEAVQPTPPARVAIIQSRPARPHQKAPARHPRDIEVQEFLHSDQFEFLAADTRGASITAPAVTRHLQVPCEKARKAG